MFSRLVRPLTFLGGFVVLAALMIMSSSMAFATGPAGPAVPLATPTPVNVSATPVETVNAGDIGVTGTFTPATTPSTTLNGSDHAGTVVGKLLVNPADNTGAGSGWDLSVSAAPLTSGTGTHPTLTTRLTTAGTGALALACAGTSTCVTTAMTNNDLVAFNSSSQALVSAASGSGMGSYTLTDLLVVDIPANAYAGTYSSAITLTIASLA